MANYDWDIIKSAEELLVESQKEEFPYFMNQDDVYGLKIQVNAHVFSPKHFTGYKFFIPRLPNMAGLRFLEIGSGHGIVSCYFAKNGAKQVLATDINHHAVENTRVNAELNSLSNLKAIKSDVFSNISDSEKFDVLFWNTPWAITPKDYEASMAPEDYGGFDPEYRSISKFILEGKKYLSENGALYLGFGVEGSSTELIDELIEKAGLSKVLIADELYAPGEKIDGELVEFRMMLLKLTVKSS